MKLLMIVPDRNDPTCFYRASGIARDLEKQGKCIIDVLQWDQIPISWQILSMYDVLMLQRPFTTEAANLVMYAKGMNIPVWVDYDDNLFAINPENRAHQTYIIPQVQDAVKKCLINADAVSVPTEYLRQLYIQFNKNIYLIPNAFNDCIFKKRELKKREKKILWRGPDAHVYDLMTHTKEMNELTQEFSDYEFLFFGYYPWFLSETSNKGFIGGVDIITYFKKIVDLCPEIVHVPLHDNIFNRCKSNIAYIEGAFAGAACVVPGWWNVPGTLSYNNPAQYYDAMKSLLTGKVSTEELNKTAWEYITDYLMLSRVNKLRVELINEIL